MVDHSGRKSRFRRRGPTAALRIGITRCVEEGWYAEVRKQAPFWVGYFPAEPPELQASLWRISQLPAGNDAELRVQALSAIWQIHRLGEAPELRRVARERRESWVRQGLSSPSGVVAPSDLAPMLESEPELKVPELGYGHGRLALQRYCHVLWKNAGRLSDLHKAQDSRALRSRLVELAQIAGLLAPPRKGLPKLLPKAKYLRKLSRQTKWIVSEIDRWRQYAGDFARDVRMQGRAEMARRAAKTTIVSSKSQREITFTVNDAWKIRFPMLNQKELHALVSRKGYGGAGRKYSRQEWLIGQRLGFDPRSIRKASLMV